MGLPWHCGAEDDSGFPGMNLHLCSCKIFLSVGGNRMVKRPDDVFDVVYDTADAHHRRCAYAMMLNRLAYNLKLDPEFAEMARQALLCQDKEGFDSMPARQLGRAEIEANGKVGK